MEMRVKRETLNLSEIHPETVLHLPSVLVNWSRCVRRGARMELSTLGIQYILKNLIETVTKWNCFVLEEDMHPWGNKTQFNSILGPREYTELDSELNYSEFKYIKFRYLQMSCWWVIQAPGVVEEIRGGDRSRVETRGETATPEEPKSALNSEPARRREAASDVFQRRPLLFASTFHFH